MGAALRPGSGAHRVHGLRYRARQRRRPGPRAGGGARFPERRVARARAADGRGDHRPMRRHTAADPRRRRPPRRAVRAPRRRRARGYPLHALRADDAGRALPRRDLGVFDAARDVRGAPSARARALRRAGGDRDPQRAALRGQRAPRARDPRPARRRPRGEREPRHRGDDPRDPQRGARGARRRIVRARGVQRVG